MSLFLGPRRCVAFFVESSARAGMSRHLFYRSLPCLTIFLTRLSRRQGTVEQYVPCFRLPVNLAVASWSFHCGGKLCAVDGIRVPVLLCSASSNATNNTAVEPTASDGVDFAWVSPHRWVGLFDRLLFWCGSMVHLHSHHQSHRVSVGTAASL